MDESPVHLLKSYCCTCLSKDRKLQQLCRVVGGLNNLYSLLSYDSEAYREGLFMEAGSLSMCWECRALLRRFSRFRRQACAAQHLLADLVERRQVNAPPTLSMLAVYSVRVVELPREAEALVTSPARPAGYHQPDHFVDCGSADVKSEPEDVDDIPLSCLKGIQNGACKSNSFVEVDGITYKEAPNADNIAESNVKSTKRRKPTKNQLPKTTVKRKKAVAPQALNENKNYFSTVKLNEEDFLETREQRKLIRSYVDATYKCETCIEGFKLKTDFDIHNEALHREKSGHTPCDVCRCYVKASAMREHLEDHYLKHACALCHYESHTASAITSHLRSTHAVGMVSAAVKRTRGERAAPGPSTPLPPPGPEQRAPCGYRCAECDQHFDNKNQRWKHVQRAHREGHACGECGKRFAFRSSLARHEATHSAAVARTGCGECGRLVRVDLARAHARTHAPRPARLCALCNKTFVSLASYEHHLKYTRAHTAQDILKHKCAHAQCGKGYRSRAELRDHVNYQHLRRTLHQCPVCGKALATRRCVTRHVRRAHHGHKEAPRDKICQLCGKAFRDKKGLREHELTHTGERPLTCSLCGATFRQSASLYTHRRRVHKMAPRNLTLELCPSADACPATTSADGPTDATSADCPTNAVGVDHPTDVTADDHPTNDVTGDCAPDAAVAGAVAD